MRNYCLIKIENTTQTQIWLYQNAFTRAASFEHLSLLKACNINSNSNTDAAAVGCAY